jgi:N-acetylmuramoyl-L-alanine amidase
LLQKEQKTMKNYFYTIGILFLSSSFVSVTFPNWKTTSKTVKTIILDAGHGGHDSGAEGWNGYYEKDIALGVALKTEKAINKLMPDVAVHLTRKTDVFVDLRRRADFANELKGDVFVSIHCNSVDGYSTKKEVVDSVQKTKIVKNQQGGKDTITEKVAVFKTVKYPKDAQGMETYIWNLANNNIKVKALKKSIAEVENAQILLDSNYKETYGGGLDINSTEFLAKASFRTKKYFVRSQKLGELVQTEGTKAGRNNRKVKQRGVGIWVLQATNMPSVLVETGYISHPDEEAYLASSQGQEKMANIIAMALLKYKDALEKPVSTTTTETTSIDILFFKKEEEISLV